MLGQAQYALRDYESAVQTLRRPETYRTTSRRMLAASLAQLGRMEEARQEAEMFMMSNPHFTIRHWASRSLSAMKGSGNISSRAIARPGCRNSQ